MNKTSSLVFWLHPDNVIFGMRAERKEYLRVFQREWLARRRARWLIENGPCAQCGSSESLEIDHVDRTQKISHRVWGWKPERRAAELLKCQVLCYACHKKKTILENRTVSDDTFRQVIALVRMGMSERRACREIGLNRNTFASCKKRGSRKELFETSVSLASDEVEKTEVGRIFPHFYYHMAANHDEHSGNRTQPLSIFKIRNGINN